MIKRTAKYPSTVAKKRPAILTASIAALLVIAGGASARAQFTNPITTTPILVQDGFGPAGDLLPNAGLEYCCPTAVAASLSYLGLNGFNQIGPSIPTTASELNLVRVLSGLMTTDPIAATNGTLQDGIATYLAAQGIGTANYSLSMPNLPTLSMLTSALQPGTVVDLVGGFADSSGNFNGFHCVALLATGVNALGQSSPNTIVVNNQLPNALTPNADVPGNVLQYLNTIPTSGVLQGDGAFELDPSQYPGFFNPTSGDVFVPAQAFILTVNPSQQSINNPTPATWNITGTQVINLDDGVMPVLAPVTGTGGFSLGDPANSGSVFLQAFGTLQMEAPDTSTGPNIISTGTWISTINSGQPFGTGSITIHEGTLALSPAAGSLSISFAAANGSGNTLTYTDGAEIALSLNGNPSLTFTLGGNTDGVTANLIRGGIGTLVIAVGGGTGDLGQNERLIINGAGGNLPQLTNGIVSPSIVGQNNDSSASGDFLTYGSNGFAKATYTLASVTPLTAVDNNAVFLADANQTVSANTTVQVYALNAGSATVGGGLASVLEVGPQSGGQAGVILNGGTIGTANLAFGSAEGLVYTSNAGGAISSAITGSGGLTTFGPGTLTLEGANTYTGPTNINSGTLQAQNTSGSATGFGDIIVRAGATLEISGASARVGVAGSTTTVHTGAALLLNGGASAGALMMESGSYLFGSGMINGPTTILGVIGNSGTPSELSSYTGVENITFNNSVTFTPSTVYSWKLNALDAKPADAGTDWSLLTFNGSFQTTNGGNDNFLLDFDLASGVPDPNSGNAFWNTSHQWLIATANSAYDFYFTDSFPAFLQGSFSGFLKPDGELDMNYTPYAFYWRGGSGNAWMGNNWTDLTGTPALGTPMNLTDVIFSATGATHQGNTTLGQDFTIHSLAVTDTAPVVVNSGAGGPYTLTIAGASGTGITVGPGANLTINSNVTLAGASDTIEVQGNGVATINGALGGNNFMNKTGSGQLTLSGANTYTGPTVLYAGTLQFGQETALYSNNQASWTAANIIVLGGATLVLNVGGPGEFTSSDVAVISALASSPGTATGGFQGGSSLGLDTTNASGGNFTYAGVIANPNGGANALGLAKLGSNTLTLTGPNTYTGSTDIQAGVVNINTADVSTNAQSLGEGGIVNLGVANTSSGALNYTGTGGNLDKEINVLGNGGDTIQNSGSGTLFLTGDTIIHGTMLNFNGGNAGINVFGAILDDASGGGLNILGGVVTLSNINLYKRATNIESGVLQAGTTTAFSPSSAFWVNAGATLDLNGNANTIGSLADGPAGGGTVTNSGNSGAALTVGNDGTSTTFSGVIQDGTSQLGLYKIGPGTLTLSGVNTYTGATAISGGTLQIGVDNALPSSATVSGPVENLGVLMLNSGATAAGTLDLNGHDQTLNGLDGDNINALLGQVVNNGGGTHTLTVGAGDASSIFNGFVNDHTNGSVGTVAVVKIGSGTFSLGELNSYTGATSIRAGALNIDTVDLSIRPQSLGEGSTVNLGVANTSSGTLNYTGTGGTLDKNFNVLGNGGDTIENSGSGPLTLSGNVTIHGTTLNFNANNSPGIYVSGVIGESGASSSVTINSGLVVFGATNTYTGATTLNANAQLDATTSASLGPSSTINLGTAAGYGSLYVGGGTLSQNINAAYGQIVATGGVPLFVSRTVTLAPVGLFNLNSYLTDSRNVGGGLNVTGLIQGQCSLIVTVGSVTLSNNGNTFSGGAYIEGGTLNINTVASGAGPQPLGECIAVNLGVNSLGNIGTLNYTGAGGTLDKDIFVSGNGTVQNSGSGPLTLTGQVEASGSTINFNDNGSGVIVQGVVGGGANSGLTVLGGVVTLTNTNTYSGATTINTGGTLNLGGGGATGSLDSSSSLVLNGGTFNYNVTDNASQTLTGAGTTINPGASVVAVAAGDAVDLRFGNITRYTGGTVDFSGPGTVWAYNLTSGNNNVVVDDNGTAFATVNGVDWATNNPTAASIGALSIAGAYQTGAGSYVRGNDIDVGAGIAGMTDVPAANFIVNTLRFNAPGLTLALSGAFNTVSTGGILVTRAGISDTISGGTIQSELGREMVIINNGSLNVSAVIADSSSGTSALTVSGSGKLTLSGQNTYTGVTTLSNGIVNLASAENLGISGPLGTSAGSNPGSIIFAGGTLQYSANNQNDYSGRFSTTPNQLISIDTNGQTVTFAAALTSPGGSLTLTDSNYGSPGTLILDANNTYTGPTTINGGTLEIGGPVNIGGSNIPSSISESSHLILGGGALNDTLTIFAYQAFNGTTINPGSSVVMLGVRDLVYLGAITRQIGGTVDFSSSNLSFPGTVSGNASVSGVNNVLVSANGTAFATVNGVDWATYIDSYGYSVTNGNIGALSVTGAYQTGVGSYVAGNDVDVGAGTANGTDAPAANFSVNTLRFNAAGLTLALSGTNTVSTGGILVTSAGVSDIISGGTIRSGVGQEMVIINNGSLNISATIADSGSGSSALTVSGAGKLTLSGQNTYTGVTRLNSGIVNLGSAENRGVSGPLGASSASNPGSIVFNGGTLQYSANNQNDYSGRFSTAANQRISIDTNGQSVTFATPLTSAGGGLTLSDSNMASPGTLMLTAANAYTGPTTVNAGTLDIGGGGATGSISSSSSLVLGGGTLAYTVTSGATQTFNGTTINPGASAVTVAIGDTVDLGGITRNIGGTVDFNGGGALGNASVSGVNNVLVSASGTAFTTVNGADWATGAAGSIGALSNTGAYQAGAGSYVAGNDIDVGASNASTTDTPAANFTVNTLRFNAAGLTLALSGTNTVSTGGILVTGAGSNAIISGGTIQSGTGREMVIFNNGSLNISSVIADSISGPSALTASGTGTLTLSGQNTYTGVTTLSSGIVNLASAENPGSSGPLGTSASSNPGSIVFNGGTLQYSPYNQYDYSGRFSTAPNQRFNIDINGETVVFSNPLTSSGGSLTLTDSYPGSPGVLYLNSENTYTGPTNINAGTLLVAGADISANPQSLGQGSTVNLGVSGVSSGALNYVGSSGTLDKAINVLGNGNDTIGNYGGTLTLSGHVTIGGTTLNLNDYGGNGINVTGVIGESGAPGSLNVLGGVVTLSNANTYTGATTVNGGMLQFAKETALYNNHQGRWTAANITVMNGSTLALNVGGPGEFTSSDVAAISALGSNTGGFQGGSILGLDTTNAAGGNFIYNGLIADTNGGLNSLGLTKLGIGTLTLTSANTYTGATTIVAGTLALTGSGTLGSGPLTIVGGALSASSAAALGGASSITLGSDTTTGTLDIPGGTLSADVTVGGAGGAVIDNTGGGTLNLTGTLTKDGNVLKLSGGVITVTGPIVGALPGSDLVVTNGCVVTLTNANNTYNGPTYVNGGATLLNGVTNALPTGTALTLGTFAEGANGTSGTYDLNGFDATIAGLSSAAGGANIVTNSGVGGTNTLTVTGSGLFGGRIQDGNNAKTALTKNGSDTLMLAGANTYTGATTVSAGTLLVSGSIATSTTTVGGTGTLGGNGGTTGAVIVNSGGTLAPGTSTSIGTLDTGALALNGDAIFHLTLDTSTGGASQVIAAGNLNIDPASVLTFSDLGANVALAPGTTLPFLDYTGIWNGGAFAGYAEDSTFTYGANTFQITYDSVDASNGDRAVSLTTPAATPEPGSVALLGFGTLLLFAGRWRRTVKMTPL